MPSIAIVLIASIEIFLVGFWDALMLIPLCLKILTPDIIEKPSTKVDGFLGGESGIRTHARDKPATGFQDRTLQPLGYLSIAY